MSDERTAFGILLSDYLYWPLTWLQPAVSSLYDAVSGNRTIQINTVSVEVLDEKIRTLIEERLSGLGITAATGTNNSAQTREVSQDIVDMLGDLDLFNM